MELRGLGALIKRCGCIFLFVFILGILCYGRKAEAAPDSIYSFITEFSVNGQIWKYGEDVKHITVNSNEPVAVEYTLYFTNSQWAEHHQNLKWGLPEGIQIKYINQNVTATLDGEATNIGTMSVVESQVHISILEEYESILAHSDNIEIRAGMMLEFEKGVHDLGEMIAVEAKETGHANARWNTYSVKVNKIDELEVSKLLGGAVFEIEECDYSENAHEYQEGQIFDLTQKYIVENETFEHAGVGFKTIEHVAALLEGEFEPGQLYYLNEVCPPIGYLPTAETVKFGFYHYTDSEKEGTQRRIKELNQIYTERYEAEGGVAVFGQEQGTLPEEDHNIYVHNSKTRKLQVLKLDAQTGEAIPNVTFTIRINAKDAEYSVDQYLALENSGWTYNNETGKLEWAQQTNEEGKLVYPEGTIPYSSKGYELAETVPEGYVGHGNVSVTEFRMDATGKVEVLSGAGVVDAVDGTITIKVLNERTADICIIKENESGQPLEGAVFAIYGLEKTDTDDVLEKDGKTYYYQQSKTSGSDGKVEFLDLSYGVYYLVEKQAPEGYQLLEDAYRVELNENTLKDGIYELEIINTKKGVQIVPTGGKGIWPYVTAGAVLFVIGSFIFFVTKQKKKRRKKRRAAAMRRRNEQKTKKG